MNQRSNLEHLQKIANDITPALEQTLASPPLDSVNPFLIPEHLTLRDGWCVFATELLANHLRKKHGLEARQLQADYRVERPDRSHTTFKHSILEVRSAANTQPTWIDPTWSQIYQTVGLWVVDAQKNPALQAEYPPQKIRVFNPHDKTFSRQVAEGLHETDNKGIAPIPRQGRVDYGISNLLRNSTRTRKIAFCEAFWNPENYGSHEPITDESRAALDQAQPLFERLIRE